MIKISNEKLYVDGNMLDLTHEIAYVIADFCEKISHDPRQESEGALDFFERAILRSLVIGGCKDLEKVAKILDDKEIGKIYVESLDEVQKSLKLIRSFLDIKASEGAENDKD